MASVKFKPRTGYTQFFMENKNNSYLETGFTGHTGIDYTNSFGTRVRLDNSGLIYKIYTVKDIPAHGWTGVYQLVPIGDVYPDGFVEVVYGHLSKIYPNRGFYPEGYVIGTEGNCGSIIYSGGQRITVEQQMAGDKRGSHVHIQYRPVVRKKEITPGKDYLKGQDGTLYYNDGYYEVLHANGTAGCVDPMLYLHSNTLAEDIKMATEHATFTLKRFATAS